MDDFKWSKRKKKLGGIFFKEKQKSKLSLPSSNRFFPFSLIKCYLTKQEREKEDEEEDEQHNLKKNNPNIKQSFFPFLCIDLFFYFKHCFSLIEAILKHYKNFPTRIYFVHPIGVPASDDVIELFTPFTVNTCVVTQNWRREEEGKKEKKRESSENWVR